MRLLDRYIGLHVLGGMLAVMLVLLALFSLGAFLNELESVGKGEYTFIHAAEYVLLTMPSLVYQMFPVVALLGAIVGLGLLAHNSELVAIRAAGVSPYRIALSVMKVGLLLMVAAALIGEWVAPAAEQRAQTMRAAAITGKVTLSTREGLWARDGDNFVNIRQIMPDGKLHDIYIYTLDAQNRLQQTTYVQTAFFQGGKWQVEEMVRSEVSEERVTSETWSRSSLESLINPDLIDVVTVEPEKLSTVGLYNYVEYLLENDLNAARYQLAFWGKIVSPFTTGLMVFLAIPFIFGPLRSKGVGQRILVGALVGIGFYLFNQTFSYLGMVYSLNPAFSAFFPTTLFLFFAIYLMRRVF